MKQETFTGKEYSRRKKKTKREEFLEMIEEIIPWEERGHYSTLLSTGEARPSADGD